MPDKEQVVVRLNQEVYVKLEQKFRVVQPTEQTTSIQVAYALGVQSVLKALREGYVV